VARARADHAAFLWTRSPERAAVLDARARQAFAELGLVPLLRRRRDPASGSWTGTGPAVTLEGRAFFMSDVVDSTGLTLRVGVREYSSSLLAAHNGIVRGSLREANGVEFKHTGDGIAAWFPSPIEAVVAAIDVQDRLVRFNSQHAGEPLHVRIGISVGDVIVDSDEQFQGLALVRARRLCDLARPGQVLVTDRVAALARSDHLRLQPVGEVVLKGFHRPEVVYRATRAPW
jgi:adenylate cyclase